MNSKTNGYIFLFITVFIYGIYGILTRFIQTTFSPFMLSGFREGLAGIIVLILTLLGLSKWNKVLKRDYLFIFLMGLISSIGNMFMFKSFSLLPLGLASFLIFTVSIISSWIIGAVFFKEKLNSTLLISLLFIVIGIFTMFKIEISGLNITGIVSAALFGICISIFSGLTKNISGEYGALQIYMMSALITSAFAFVFALFFNEKLPEFGINITLMWFVIFSVCTILANGLYILALKTIDVSVTSIINPLQSVVTLILSFFIFGELISTRTIIGGFLILLASALPYLKERFKINI